jgi:hypothetical protein
VPDPEPPVAEDAPLPPAPTPAEALPEPTDEPLLWPDVPPPMPLFAALPLPPATDPVAAALDAPEPPAFELAPEHAVARANPQAALRARMGNRPIRICIARSIPIVGIDAALDDYTVTLNKNGNARMKRYRSASVSFFSSCSKAPSIMPS